MHRVCAACKKSLAPPCAALIGDGALGNDDLCPLRARKSVVLPFAKTVYIVYLTPANQGFLGG